MDLQGAASAATNAKSSLKSPAEENSSTRDAAAVADEPAGADNNAEKDESEIDVWRAAAYGNVEAMKRMMDEDRGASTNQTAPGIVRCSGRR